MFRRPLRSTPTKRNTTRVGFAALILMAIVGLSYREWRQYHRANADAARTREILDSVETLLSTIVDAETGQRGFLLTGADRYLEPYSRAIRAVPGELANLKRLLPTPRQGEPADLERLTSLVDRKLAELRQTIELRRTQGAGPALDVVLSDRGKQTMDEIRAIASAIQRRQSSAQHEASLEREAAAQLALLATVATSLIFFFFFIVSLEPLTSTYPRSSRRPRLLVYGAAVAATVVGTLLRMALTPLLGGTAVSFITFFPVVLFSSWYGGFRAAVLSLVLSALAAVYYFVPPVGSFLIPDPADRVRLLIFILVSLGVALLGHSQRRAVERAGWEAAQRKEAENAEREQRQRFETTLASIGDAVISTDSQGRIVFINQVAQSLLRAPESAILGKHLDDVFRIVNEFSRETVESPVTKVLREGAIVGLANHTILIAQDGTEIPIDDSGAPIRWESGPIQGTVLVFRDITERRHAEATARLLASIVESSADGIMSKDMNGVVTSWNAGAERIFGYSAEEMIGRPISALIPPGLVDETPAMLERVKRGERIEQYETIRRAKNGKVVNVAITWSPILDALGRIVGASKIVRDVTERTQSEERFRLAVEAAPNGMVMTNEGGEVILVNSHVERLFGYRREEMIGQPVEILVPDRVRGEHPQFRRSFYANPRTRLMGEGWDLRGRRKDGSEFPVEIGLNPIETSRGRWVLSAIVDITERKRIEQERLDLLAKQQALESERALREAEEELARVARALTLGELAASIAHEVNQPLAAVVTNAEACRRWLAGETPNLQEARESLALIVRDGNLASDVIRRIRQFLKKDAPPSESLDINEAVQEAVAFTRAELVKSNVALRLELSTGLPPVRGDRVQLQQVILNLILNAREAMERVAGRPRELLVTTRKFAGDGVAVAVRDSGIGIKPEDVNRIFDAFFTTKAMGIGMGLSISRSIVEAHGGRIWAESDHGPGLTVQFSLPAWSEKP